MSDGTKKKLSLEEILMDLIKHPLDGDISLTVGSGGIVVSLPEYSHIREFRERVGVSFDVEGAAVYVGIARDILTAKERDRMRHCRQEIGDVLLAWPERAPRGRGRWRYVVGNGEADRIGAFTLGMSNEVQFAVFGSRDLTGYITKAAFAGGHRFERVLEEGEL